ncbi:Homeodomain [Desmophyllum pertusum]|uniref:Homeodomain n=1 Tax=Desmophyllum pertusum TaxID=174260 RepID=A0A9X0D9Y1_9CNID|nr:Homeodomain [Desmophyllum pertusum]
MEPMVELEPCIAEGPDNLRSFLDQNMEQNLGSANANTQDPKGPAKYKEDLDHSSAPVKIVRTKISLYQKVELEYVFQHTPYPSRVTRAQLSLSLGLGHQTVLNWFKKRRFRWRRQSSKPGVPVPSQVHALGHAQYLAPQEPLPVPCYFHEPFARHQGSQQFPFY